MNRSTMPDTRAVPPQGAPALSAGQLAELRAMLEQQRSFRLDQLWQLRRSGGDAAPARREITESLTTGARAALRDVLDALRRMDDGRYGRCRTCDTALSPERLEVLPQVVLCMSCQRVAEAR